MITQKIYMEGTSIVTSCRCGGLQPDSRWICKRFDNVEQGMKEYNLWQFIREQIGGRADQYFSLPVALHQCKYGCIISFINCGHELSSVAAQDAICKGGAAQALKALGAIFYHVAQGLDRLNSIGIVHLDVKPENIIIDLETLSCKIIDIGNGLKINSEFIVKPSIDLLAETITKPTYIYYPPHKFYFEEWISDLTEDNLIKACNLLTDYCTEHRKLIKDLHVDQEHMMKLVNVYQRDDPRNKVLKVLRNNKLYDYQRMELKAWDVYGLGVTILQILKLYFDDTEELKTNIWYHRLLEHGCNMTSPDPINRMSFTQLIDVLV